MAATFPRTLTALMLPIDALTVTTRVALVVPPSFVAVIVMLTVEADGAVPEITPVTESMLVSHPGGDVAP